MALSFYIPQFDGVRLNRLLRKESIDVAVFWSRIVLSVLLVVLLVALINSAFSVIIDVNTTVDKASNLLEKQLAQSSVTSDVKSSGGDYSFLKQKSPFGEVGAKTDTVAAVKDEPKISNMALALIGTFLTPGQIPYAIIEDTKKNNQEVFNIDDLVFEEATLVGIFRDYVEIRRNGEIEILKLDESAATDTGGAASDFITVAENELNDALDNLPLLLTQARAVPYFQDGKAVGLRLFAIKTGSLYDKIGLKNGDILKSINGNSLGDITQAVKLFEKLREERSISLALERNRAEQTIRYEIR